MWYRKSTTSIPWWTCLNLDPANQNRQNRLLDSCFSYHVPNEPEFKKKKNLKIAYTSDVWRIFIASPGMRLVRKTFIFIARLTSQVNSNDLFWSVNLSERIIKCRFPFPVYSDRLFLLRCLQRKNKTHPKCQHALGSHFYCACADTSIFIIPEYYAKICILVLQLVCFCFTIKG